MSYVIVTDSATDLPASVIKKFKLKVIPTPVVIDGVDHLDGETIFPEEFYKLLDEQTHKISTYHINPAMFEAAFEPYAQNGREVLYFCFSTGVAATFSAANVAKQALLEKYPDFRLTIFDSQKASTAFGLMVCRLLEMQQAGAPADVIMQAAEFYRQHIRVVLTVQTLTYLIKGGRVSKTSGTVAEFLHMKPLLHLDEKGALERLEVVRGRPASLQALVDHMKNDVADLPNQLVGMCHGGDPEGLKSLQKLVKQAGASQFLIGEVGCAIGAHTGRGILALCYLDAPETEFRAWLPEVSNYS